MKDKMLFEWRYFWGTIDNEKFFHFAWFRFKNREFSHLSIDGKFYEGKWKCDNRSAYTPILSFSLDSKYGDSINVENEKNIHISNPSLSGIGLLNGKIVKIDAWYDYESGKKVFIRNWKWTSIKFNNGLGMFLYKREFEKGGAYVIENGKSSKTEYYLEDCLFEEKGKKIIFNPKYGRPYSEQPIVVIKNGNVIGCGVIEETYGWDFKKLVKILIKLFKEKIKWDSFLQCY